MSHSRCIHSIQALWSTWLLGFNHLGPRLSLFWNPFTSIITFEYHQRINQEVKAQVYCLFKCHYGELRGGGTTGIKGHKLPITALLNQVSSCHPHPRGQLYIVGDAKYLLSLTSYLISPCRAGFPTGQHGHFTNSQSHNMPCVDLIHVQPHKVFTDNSLAPEQGNERLGGSFQNSELATVLVTLKSQGCSLGSKHHSQHDSVTQGIKLKNKCYHNAEKYFYLTFILQSLLNVKVNICWEKG